MLRKWIWLCLDSWMLEANKNGVCDQLNGSLSVTFLMPLVVMLLHGSQGANSTTFIKCLRRLTEKMYIKHFTQYFCILDRKLLIPFAWSCAFIPDGWMTEEKVETTHIHWHTSLRLVPCTTPQLSFRTKLEVWVWVTWNLLYFFNISKFNFNVGHW